MSGTTLQPHSRPAAALTLVLIGRIGAGKSATGNTVLGRAAFRSCLSSTAVTRTCQVESGALNGHKLTVVDTPGLFGPTSHDEVLRGIHRSVSQAACGTVVFLVVVQSGSFTADERRLVRTIQSVFGPEAEHFTVALFTRGDDLRAEDRGLEELIGEDPAVKDFIRDCRGGYHVLDNRDPDPSQVLELLQKIQNLVQRNGDRDAGRGDAFMGGAGRGGAGVGGAGSGGAGVGWAGVGGAVLGAALVGGAFVAWAVVKEPFIAVLSALLAILKK